MTIDIEILFMYLLKPESMQLKKSTQFITNSLMLIKINSNIELKAKK